MAVDDPATEPSIVSLEVTEEGAKFKEQELPIDINFGKLSDWLVERKKLPADWRRRLAPIKARASKILQKTQREAKAVADDPALLRLSPETLSFLDAKNIRDSLSAKRPDARTIFGGLSGVTGEWDSLVRAYEKDSLFLGEASQILLQNVNYDILYWKKQISRLQQQAADMDRKEAEMKRLTALSVEKFETSCKSLGIQGKDDVRGELRGLVQKLPEVFQQAREAADSLPLLPLLEEFRERPQEDAPLPENGTEGGGGAAMVDACEAIKTDEIVWDLGPDGGTQTSEAEAEAPPGIQWDIDLSTSALKGDENSVDESGAAEAAVSINWDIDVGAMEVAQDVAHGGTGGEGANEDTETVVIEAADAAPVQINWDVDLSAVEVEMEGEGEGGGQAGLSIDWNVDLEQNGEGEEGGGVGGGGQGLEASFEGGGGGRRSRLWGASFRAALLDDLLELHAFLRQRAVEMEGGEKAVVQDQLLARAPADVQSYGADMLRQIDGVVAGAIRLLTCRQTQDLLLILSSKRFVERICESLEQKRANQRKLLDGIHEIQDKRKEIGSSLAATWPKLDDVMKRTRKVKAMVEASIFTMYGGRPVNIIGEINNLLP